MLEAWTVGPLPVYFAKQRKDKRRHLQFVFIGYRSILKEQNVLEQVEVLLELSDKGQLYPGKPNSTGIDSLVYGVLLSILAGHTNTEFLRNDQ